MLATFGAGCFWGVELEFRRVAGVRDALVGYEGGTLANPRYEDVCTDESGHAEVVQVDYDPEVVSFDISSRCSSHSTTQQRRTARGRMWGLNTARRSLPTTMPRRRRPKPRSERSRPKVDSDGRSSPKSSRPRPSTRPRNTTNDTWRSEAGGAAQPIEPFWTTDIASQRPAIEIPHLV